MTIENDLSMNCLKFILVGVAIGLISLQTSASQTQIEASGPEGTLRGTIIRSQKQNSPVALILPGSGPTDRDGNSPQGLSTNTYKLLAEGLATQGISTLRIDKRGLYGSAAAIKNPETLTIKDYVADAQAWIASIQKQTDTPCVWLIGHSEGALVSLLAAQNPSGICGLILVASTGSPLGMVIREQLEANPANAPILDEAKSILNKLETGNRVEESTITPVLLPLFHAQAQNFLISELLLDPAKLIASIDKPILILQGLRDIQVSANDGKALKNANPQAMLIELDNTNHILKTIENDDRNANIQTYSNPTLPLANGVIDSIYSFIQTHQ